jgi:hypothetical protein
MKQIYYALIILFIVIVGCETKNFPPDTPSVPIGDSSGVVGTSYIFSSHASDINNDRVTIRFAWGDGDTTLWGFFGAPDSVITKSHSWTNAGFYYVKAQARDEHDEISSWSAGHQIYISN